MNKKNIFFSTLILILVVASCGPAAEDRTTMVSRSKVVQDSIANLIKTAMQEAEMPANQNPAPAVVDTTKK